MIQNSDDGCIKTTEVVMVIKLFIFLVLIWGLDTNTTRF